MDTNPIKISNMAKELGVSTKTLYNWISAGKLQQITPGYVDHTDAYDVWVAQRRLRSIQSYFLAKGTIRDSFGRWRKSHEQVEQSGE